MNAAELARNHPILYHRTVPESVDGILRHGLLSTSQLLALFEVPGAVRTRIERHRRASRVPIFHPVYGTAIIADNLPLSEGALATCLDDGLTPEEWLLILNSRVFFWPDKKNLCNHLGARLNRGRRLIVMEFDTLGLAERHIVRMELAAINTGSTIRKPARRGLSTFSPAQRYTYEEWRKLRGKRDSVREISVVDGVPDAANYLIRYWQTSE